MDFDSAGPVGASLVRSTSLPLPESGNAGVTLLYAAATGPGETKVFGGSGRVCAQGLSVRVSYD